MVIIKMIGFGSIVSSVHSVRLTPLDYYSAQAIKQMCCTSARIVFLVGRPFVRFKSHKKQLNVSVVGSTGSAGNVDNYI